MAASPLKAIPKEFWQGLDDDEFMDLLENGLSRDLQARLCAMAGVENPDYQLEIMLDGRTLKRELEKSDFQTTEEDEISWRRLH